MPLLRMLSLKPINLKEKSTFTLACFAMYFTGYCQSANINTIKTPWRLTTATPKPFDTAFCVSFTELIPKFDSVGTL